MFFSLALSEVFDQSETCLLPSPTSEREGDSWFLRCHWTILPNRQGEHWLYLPVQLSMNRLTKHGQINAIQSVVFTCNQMNKTNNSLLAVSEDPIQTDDSSTKTQCQQLITQAFLWQQISYSQGMGKLYIEANSAKTKRNSCTVCVCVCVL